MANTQKKPAVEPQSLSEKDFIQDKPLSKSFRSLPFWLWPVLLAVAALLAIGTKGWYDRFIQKQEEHDPFLEVTNRNFSIFLWQFPGFLRNNASKKAGYLPGFMSTSENLIPALSEEFVSAPPDLIFLYHTWHRLLSPAYIPRPISPREFAAFLEQLPEWQPKNWKQAPNDYVQMINSKEFMNIENLQALPEMALPIKVREAFQGWKNYFKEGTEINETQPTFEQVEEFLQKYPAYARNYWRNIQKVDHEIILSSDYLLATSGKHAKEGPFPAEQLAPFFKVALFNAFKAKTVQ